MTNQIINSFIDAMTRSGCQPNKQSDINPDGKDNYYRIKGDKKNNRGGYCLTIESDGFAYGNFINFRTGEKGKWNSKGEFKGLSDEEREEIDNRVRANEQRRAKLKAELHESVATKANEELKKFKKATVKNEYLNNKEIKPYNAKIDGDDLIIPFVSMGKIWGWQRILPNGEKYNLKDAKKEGCYCPLVKPSDDKSILLVCEGFATGSTIRAATDLPTYASFDAGNLLPVVAQLKEQYPESKVIICADNDHSTKIRGKLVNTGLIKAQQAAVKTGGTTVVYPAFNDDVKEGNSDFNDLYLMQGLTAVKDLILPLVANKGSGDVEASVVQDRENSTVSPNEFGDYGLPFKVLGYKDGTYFYYSFGQKEIIKLNAGSHTLMNLLQLATLEEWEGLFINSPTAKIPLLAANKLFSTAKRRGFFKEDDRIRGTGVWKDAGRLIVNCGNKIYMDSVEIEFHEIISKYVYVTGSKMPSLVDGDINTDFTVLRNIFSLPTWDNPASGVLLAGWIVIAPLCSALPFRPHIFLTGQSGSGKSTIIDMIKKTLEGISLNKDGTSSEASIRSSMGYNARPIIFDEAEGDGTRVTSMDAVLSLARLSSSGGTIDKYGQNEFKAQSPFCFSAVNPPIKKSSDESRISLMVLKKNRASAII